jgi:hypothetical protein
VDPDAAWIDPVRRLPHTVGHFDGWI